MGWITRRIAGAIVFSCVASILGAYAVAKGYISGEPTLSTACGAAILGFSFLVSLAVTTHMKHKAKIKKAWEEYYAYWYPQYYRR